MARNFKQTDAFPSLGWKQGELERDARTAYQYTVARAQEAAEWYFSKKNGLQHGCRFLRLSAILLTGFAAVVPLLPGICGSGGPNPLWSAVALVIAGTMVAVDRFFGFTTGWIRYILAGQQLSQALEVFQFDCERQRLKWDQPEPTRDQVAVLLGLCHDFLVAIHGVVADETKAWANEFGEVIRQMDEQIKAASQAAAQRSAVHVMVLNGNQCAEGWRACIDSRPPEQRTGKEAVFDVPAGMHVIRVEGVRDGKTLRAEKGINLRASEIVDLTVELA